MQGDDLFKDPHANTVIASAGWFPVTSGFIEATGTPVLGVAMDWDANGDIYGVMEFPITFSLN